MTDHDSTVEPSTPPAPPKRPWTVKLLAALGVLPAAFAIISGMRTLIAPSEAEATLGFITQLFSILLIGSGLIALLLGVALWRGSSIAWVITVALAIWMTLTSIIALDPVGAAIFGGCTALALVSTTRAFFDVKIKR
jgi:hypothetical protein